MKNASLRMAALAAFSAALTGSAVAEDRVVNVYNWSDYIDESILEDFTKETGIKVVYDVFDSNEILETKMLAGSSGYDVVVPTADFLQRQIQAGVFEKLDKSKLPNISNMWQDIIDRTAAYGQVNDYAVDYMWGTTGIGYNVDKAAEILGEGVKPDWNVIFDPELIAKFKDCGVHLLDAPTELFPAALNYLGFDPNSVDSAELEKAAELLKSIRPSVRKFHSSEYINALANGDICLAVGWSGDVLQARDRAAEADAGVKVDYSIPAGGALMWFDMMAIPADAPHKEEAYAFINYIMKAEVAAKATNYVYYANGNKASQEFINADVLEDPAIYPPAETVAKLYVHLPLDPKSQRVVTRHWTSVVTGQ